MSIQYCEYCHKDIDLDTNDEHFTEEGECYEMTEEKAREVLDDTSANHSDIIKKALKRWKNQ